MVDGKFITSEEFASGINKYFVCVGGQPLPVSVTSPSNNNATPLQQLSVGKIKLLIKKLDTTKSTNSSDYPTWVSKDCSEDICIPLQDILNSMLQSGVYPNKWKMSQITPLPKCNNPSEYKHYRPISLLFHLGKLAEQVIVDKMRFTIDKVISPSQFAYRPNLSTTDALLKYIDDLTEQLDDPGTKFIQSAFLDFSKAFDRLQPALVIEKMISYGFHTKIVSLVSSFLSGRKQCVKFSNCFSDYILTHVGSPQGTKLGPLLWLIYVNDLQAEDYHCIKYADDTTFYRRSTDHFSTNLIGDAVSATNTWSFKNSMILNSSKTVILNTSLSSRHSHVSDVILEDVVLSPATETKFLGVIVDDKISFSEHSDFLVSKCNSRLFLMRKLKTLGLNNAGLKTFFESNIRSILIYGAPAWFTIMCKQSKDKLESIQRHATRVIFPHLAYDERLTELRMQTLRDFIFSICVNHFKRIEGDPSHPLFKCISFNHCKRSSRSRNTGTTHFRPSICRTKKRSNSFFQFFMTFFNNQRIYIE